MFRCWLKKLVIFSCKELKVIFFVALNEIVSEKKEHKNDSFHADGEDKAT